MKYYNRQKETAPYTLKQISAYNVAKCILSESDVQNLHIPQSLYKLVSMFLDTYSGDYMCV